MTNKEKWINQTRATLVESDIDESRISDDDLLKFLKASLCAQICETMNLKYKWQYDMYWEAFISTVEPPGSVINSIDAEMFRDNMSKN